MRNGKTESAANISKAIKVSVGVYKEQFIFDRAIQQMAEDIKKRREFEKLVL